MVIFRITMIIGSTVCKCPSNLKLRITKEKAQLKFSWHITAFSLCLFVVIIAVPMASGQNGIRLTKLDCAIQHTGLNLCQRNMKLPDSLPILRPDSSRSQVRKEIKQLNETIRRSGKSVDSLTANTLKELSSKLESLSGRGESILNSARTSIPSITIPTPGGLPPNP